MSTIQALPYYNASNQRLLVLDTTFDELVTNIGPGVIIEMCVAWSIMIAMCGNCEL